MELTPIMRTLDNAEPSMRIYPNYVSLNSAAVELLGIEDGQFIQIRLDGIGNLMGRKRLFIGKAPNGSMAFRVYTRKGRRSLTCSSRVLAHYLSESLEGFGLYRICPEDEVESSGSKWYGIFFKRYD